MDLEAGVALHFCCFFISASAQGILNLYVCVCFVRFQREPGRGETKKQEHGRQPTASSTSKFKVRFYFAFPYRQRRGTYFEDFPLAKHSYR